MGSYSVRYVERSGNCGALPEQIVVIEPNTPAANCHGTWSITADSCAIDADLTCLDAATGDSVEERGHLAINLDASMISGALQIILTDPNGIVLCSSTYNVTYTRL
jgi:hypothetical protein